MRIWFASRSEIVVSASFNFMKVSCAGATLSIAETLTLATRGFRTTITSSNSSSPSHLRHGRSSAGILR